jgi:hypothetical protein
MVTAVSGWLCGPALTRETFMLTDEGRLNDPITPRCWIAITQIERGWKR